MTDLALDDRTSSQLLREMKQLDESKVGTKVLKSLQFQRFPEGMQDALGIDSASRDLRKDDLSIIVFKWISTTNSNLFNTMEV